MLDLGVRPGQGSPYCGEIPSFYKTLVGSVPFSLAPKRVIRTSVTSFVFRTLEDWLGRVVRPPWQVAAEGPALTSAACYEILAGATEL